MKRSGLLAVLCCFAHAAASLGAGVQSDATSDARRLMRCMKGFDAACTASLTYTKFMEDMGMPRSVMVESFEKLYANLKSVGAVYTVFVLGEAKQPFSSDGRIYQFIPYIQQLEVPGRGGRRLEAYFIGVSHDQGKTWQFVDGVSANPDRIKLLIPSYGGPLPSVSTREIPPGGQTP